jgi:GT2 family glycosyltransferase
MTSEPFVSIIIVNYNGKHFLSNCLNSLENIDYKNYEIIVVDNNSSDGSVDFITKNFLSVKIIKLSTNEGFAKPNNIASKDSKGKYILFLNNDTIVTKIFLSELITTAESNKEYGIFQSLLLKPNKEIDSSGDFINELGIVYNSKSSITKIRKISSARGASMMIRKSLFRKLHGFDERFFVSFEDVDLCWRSWILGNPVVIVPSSVVYHIGGQTIKTIKNRIAFHGFKNQICMKMTNFEANLVFKNLFLFFIKYGIRELRIWIDYKLYKKTYLSSTEYETNSAPNPSLKIILKSIIWIFFNLKYIYKKHKIVNSSRVISTKKLKELKIMCNVKQ